MADESPWAVRLIDRVSSSAKAMRSSVGRLENSLNSMVKTANGSGNIGKALGAGLQSGVTKVKEGMLIAGLAVAGVAAGVGSLTVGMADFAQTTRIGFQSVAKHGASAEKLFTHARTLAEDLSLDVKDTSKTFLKFLALQFDPAMATDLIKMGADMRALGADAEGVDRIFAQLGQIQAKGKLQGEELVVLAENGLSTQLVYEALGKQLGKTKDEILKMQAAGKLTSDMAFPAIMAAVMKKTGSSQLGQVGKKMADQTLSGMAGRLKAQAQNLFLDLGTAATPALMGAFKPIGDELSALMKNPALKEGLIVAMETIGNVVKDAIPFVKTFVGAFADGFMEAWPAIKGAIGVLFEGFGSGASWMGTVREFATVLGKIVAFAVGVGTVFGGMVAAGIQIASAAIQIMTFMWEGLINGIGAALFWVDDFFANLGAKWDALDFGALATSIIDGLVNGIRSGITRVTTAVGELGSATLASLKGVLGIHSPSTEFAWLGEMSGEGFNQGLTNSLDTVGPRVSSLTSGAAGDVAGARGGAGPITIQIHVSSNSSEGKQIGSDIGDELEPRLGSLFERWNLEAA